MQKSDYYYELPQDLIAQTPLESRERSRLLCMDRNSGMLEHRRFYELPELLREGDCLVLNDSRVLPARLTGRLDTGTCSAAGKINKADEIEVLLLHETSSSNNTWECLTRPGKKTKAGAKIIFGNGDLTATVKCVENNGNRLIEFDCNGIFMEILEKLGKVPLPPYIHEKLDDAERYQTVYSNKAGSAAAPTAGLHFTKDLLDMLSNKGVQICYVTLHVGPGTFRPVKTDNIKDHLMHEEYFIINKKTADTINHAKKSGNRVIAVGTTSCRVLESCSDESGIIFASSGFTNIFIYPGYYFKCLDGLITNFHLPESTLIMLVSAFAGRENILAAYKEAIHKRYRFFSFGDAMLIT